MLLPSTSLVPLTVFTLLAEGDAAQLTAAGPREIIAGEQGAEVLIWAAGRR